MAAPSKPKLGVSFDAVFECIKHGDLYGSDLRVSSGGIVNRPEVLRLSTSGTCFLDPRTAARLHDLLGAHLAAVRSMTNG